MKRIKSLFIIALWAVISNTSIAQKIRVDTAYFDKDGNQVIKTDEYLTYEVRPLNKKKKIHGVVGKFTKAGRLVEAMEFEKGEKTGSYERFNRQGKLIVYGDFVKGKKTGFWTTLDQAGSVISLDEYDSEGNLIESRGKPRSSREQLSTSGDPVVVTEKKPEFPGGAEEWNRFLERTLKYPVEAKRNGYQGDVHLSFIVLKDGRIAAIRVIESPDYSLGREGIRVLKASPKWTPGNIDGKPIDSEVKLRLRFRLR